MPRRYFPITRWEGNPPRPVSYFNGCKIHSNMCDLVVWDDGTEECMGCAGDRQVTRMTDLQKKNVAFNMPYIKDWIK